MLRPLLLFLLTLGAAAFTFGWLRRRLSAGRPGERLSRDELRELTRQSRRAPELDRALATRSKILEALEGRTDRADLRRRVDGALRRLAAQARLRSRIREALESGPALPARDVDEDVEAFENRQVALGRLARQAQALDEALERGALELSNLHLALLELSAAEAVEVRGALGEALGELESAGESARRDREAEAEVARFLASRAHLERRH